MKYKLIKLSSIIQAIVLKLRYRGQVDINLNSCFFCGRVTVECRKGGSIRFGSVVVETNVYFASSGKLLIGDNTYFNRNSAVVCRDAINIGEGCFFGPGVYIYDHDHRFGVAGVENVFRSAPVSIGKNCWIGAGCIILRGTYIGDNCIIGAGTVVSGNIPSNSIVKMDRKLLVEALRKEHINTNE